VSKIMSLLLGNQQPVLFAMKVNLQKVYKKEKGKHKPIYTMDIWDSFIAYSALNNAH
jgi:hypothetical protein